MLSKTFNQMHITHTCLHFNMHERVCGAVLFVCVLLGFFPARPNGRTTVLPPTPSPSCVCITCVFVSVWCRHTDTVISEKGRPWMKETWPTSCQSRYKHKHYSTNTHSLAPINSSLRRNSNIAGRLFFSPFFFEDHGSLRNVFRTT